MKIFKTILYLHFIGGISMSMSLLAFFSIFKNGPVMHKSFFCFQIITLKLTLLTNVLN